MELFGYVFSLKKKKRRFEGAAKTKRTSNFYAPASSADTAIRSNLPTLRNRSRDLVRNNAYAATAIDVLVDHIVGEGIIGTVKHPSKRQQKRLNDMFKKWAESKEPDYYGLQNLYGLQRLAVRSALEGGEVLTRSRVKRSGFPLEFQLLEGDHLPLYENRLVETGRVAYGIEYNEEGKRIAYHVLREHPGANDIFNNYDLTRVDAENMNHMFSVDRAGQTRGVPRLAPVLIKIKDLEDYEDAQILRQKIAASWAVFVRDTEGADLDDEDEIELLEKVEPGMIEVLPPGKDVTFATPPTIENYKEFMSVGEHKIAKAVGISYEALTGDLSEVNFSSARMGFLEMQRTIKRLRSTMVKPMFLDFVSRKFLQMAFLMGENVAEAYIQWTPPRSEMIDPTKEIPAARDAVRAGLSTLSEEVRKMGRNFEDHIEEWKEDADKLDENSLFFDSDPRRINRGGSLQDNLVNDTTEDDNIDVSDNNENESEDDDEGDSNDDQN